MEQKFFEDFQIGDTFRVPSKTMNDAHFLFFSAITGDTHPIHYDVEYAKKTRFGRPVAHAYLITVLTAMGASNLSWAVDESIVAFVEQSSKILKPVFVGDTLSPQGEIVELIPGNRTGTVRFRTTVTNQSGEVVLEGSQTYIIKRRPTE